jgi:hypothetical protein
MMRAPRFPLQLPVRYRPVSAEGEWRDAKTGNVSASGVLVQVPDPLQVDTRIEFRLGLDEAAQSAPRAVVCGMGRVVRIVSTGESPHPGFAVVIEDYAFQHRPSPAAS